MKIICLLFLAIIMFNTSFASQDFYTFPSVVQQKRFQALTSELRCLVCQNQNLAESNASLAQDLRQQVYQQILQGNSNEQIIQYLVSRYGNFILYKPPFYSSTFALWLGPFIVLIISIGFLISFLKNNKQL